MTSLVTPGDDTATPTQWDVCWRHMPTDAMQIGLDHSRPTSAAVLKVHNIHSTGAVPHTSIHTVLC